MLSLLTRGHKVPNATQSSSSGAATLPPTSTTTSGFGAGIPQAPSNAPTFPGDGSPDDTTDGGNSALGMRPAAGVAVLALGLALIL